MKIDSLKIRWTLTNKDLDLGSDPVNKEDLQWEGLVWEDLEEREWALQWEEEEDNSD